VILETSLADALFVNWAVPAEALPSPPEPLTLDTALHDGRQVGFVTLVLFRQCGLRLAALPWPSLTFAQCNLRVPVRDPEGAAGVWLLRELVPAWVVPLARTIGRQPVSAAVFDRRSDGRDQRWTVHAGRVLSLAARPGAATGVDPRLGDWPTTVGFFRDRPRAWVRAPRDPDGVVRRIETAHPALEGVPMTIEFGAVDWLASRLPTVDEAAWARPHSAFQVAPARLTLEVGRVRVPAVRAHDARAAVAG